MQREGAVPESLRLELMGNLKKRAFGRDIV